jgi:hypothetical protein
MPVRKDEKQQVAELIATLRDAHREIRTLIKSAKREEAAVILADCQECMESVYAFVCDAARLNETEHQTLQARCTDYIRALFEVSNADSSVSATECYEQLQRTLKSAANFIINDLPTRKEIVFFPYKAAMWDCLESVWSAACADRDCDVYVVPIPYYTKNRDGSLGRRHYEGTDFPRYVTVMPFTKYSLKDRKPDIAYIHNPYDEGNHVTSIDPGYYCEEIKKYAGLLVYVPYFVAGTSGMMMKTAASYRADLTIALSAAFGRDIAQIAGEKKVAALGNPKVDAVLNPIADITLPDEWRQIIAGRKVIFFNTHINSLINLPNRQIAKLRSIFADFAGRKDLVLLWRPHPLSAETIRSMRASVLQSYQRLVDEYRANNIGIYDESADFHTAFFAADAYYGDPSSLSYLFGLTGKPMLQINTGNITPDRELLFSSARLIGDTLYAVSMDFQLLFAVNMEEGKARYLAPITKVHLRKNCILPGMAHAEGKLLCAPSLGEHICVYDTASGEREHISLKPEFFSPAGSINFQDVVVCGSRVFFIPFTYGRIVCYDKADGSLRYIDFRDKLRPIQTQECPIIDGAAFGIGSAVVEGEIYIPLRGVNAVFVLNAAKLTSRVIPVGSKRSGFAACCFAEGCLWFSPAAGKSGLLRWNIKTGETTEFPEINGRGLSCWQIVYADGRVWVNMPAGLGLCSVDVATNEVHFETVWDSDMEIGGVPRREFAMFLSGENNAYLLAQSAGDRRIYRIDRSGRKALFVPDLDEEQTRLVRAALPDKDTGILSSGYFRWENRLDSPAEKLARMIECEPVSAEQTAAFSRIIANSDGSAGKKIHEFVKRRSN